MATTAPRLDFSGRSCFCTSGEAGDFLCFAARDQKHGGGGGGTLSPLLTQRYKTNTTSTCECGTASLGDSPPRRSTRGRRRRVSVTTPPTGNRNVDTGRPRPNPTENAVQTVRARTSSYVGAFRIRRAQTYGSIHCARVSGASNASKKLCDNNEFRVTSYTRKSLRPSLVHASDLLDCVQKRRPQTRHAKSKSLGYARHYVTKMWTRHYVTKIDGRTDDHAPSTAEFRRS